MRRIFVNRSIIAVFSNARQKIIISRCGFQCLLVNLSVNGAVNWGMMWSVQWHLFETEIVCNIFVSPRTCYAHCVIWRKCWGKIIYVCRSFHVLPLTHTDSHWLTLTHKGQKSGRKGKERKGKESRRGPLPPGCQRPRSNNARLHETRTKHTQRNKTTT